MARVPEEEIEQPKEAASERLAEARGVKLRETERIVGLCRFTRTGRRRS